MQQNRRSVFSLIRRGALCALALVLLCAAALAQDYPYETIVNANVNMRRSASSSSTVLNRLKQGEEITVLGVSGNYYRVSYAGRTGYIMKQYVVDETTVLNPETASGYPYYTTTKDSVNLRQQASVNSARLTEIPGDMGITQKPPRCPVCSWPGAGGLRFLFFLDRTRKSRGGRARRRRDTKASHPCGQEAEMTGDQ